jgi:hypothetical protein
MRVRQRRQHLNPFNPLEDPTSWEYVRGLVRLYEPKRMWLYYLEGGLRSTPYFLPAPAIVVVNAVFARSVLVGIFTGLLALIAGPIAGFGWSRRIWELPLVAPYEKWTSHDLRTTPSETVYTTAADIDAACMAVIRAKLIPQHMRTNGEVEFPAVLQIAWPSFRGAVDEQTRYGEVRDLILGAGLQALHTPEHVIGRDPEPPPAHKPPA